MANDSTKDQEQEVSLAVLSSKMDLMLGKVSDLCEQVKTDHDQITMNKGAISFMNKQHEKEVSRLEERADKIERRQNRDLGINSALTAVLTSIAAIIGVNQ